jgi:ATP-dependent Zn protease
MVSQYGMYPHTLLSIDPAAVADTAAGEKMLKMAEKILEDEMAVTLQPIREGKDKITKLAAVLLEKNQLTGKEIREILSGD